jgi:hypothetical protein
MGSDWRSHDLYNEIKDAISRGNQKSWTDSELVGLVGVAAFNVACELEHLSRSDKAGMYFKREHFL